MKTTLIALACLFTGAVAHAAPKESAAVPPESLYQWKADLTDQTGAKVGVDVFQGHPVLVTMFYSRCAYACPLIVSSIKRFEASLDPKQRAELRVLLVSMDPDHDNVEAMAALAKLHKVDEKRWRFARTSKDGVMELAALLGMTYRLNPDGSYSHSAEITLLDAQGVKQARLDSPGDDQAELSAQLAKLLASKVAAK